MSNTTNDSQATILVTGATGFIGRWLLAALTRRGQRVAALVRGATARGPELRAFVRRIGGDPTLLEVVEGDVEKVGLGLSAALPDVRIVHHLAARFAFGLDVEEARRTNVEGTRNVVEWAAARPSFERFVFLGGYRMTTVDHRAVDAASIRARYAEGAYEGSKHEAYALFRELARERGLSWTAVHPSALIGDARTGETTQTAGLGDTLRMLHARRLPALAGSKRTFIPVVTVDYLAAYLATVPLRAESAGKDLVVFDPASPRLPELVAMMARHMGTPAPTHTLPIGLLRALPRAISGVERESLSFLSEDAYDTREGDAHAAAMGLVHPPLQPALERWCDFLVATRFLDGSTTATTAATRGRFVRGTFVVGDLARAKVALLHGIPFDSDAMAPLADRLGPSSARADIPGLGRSGELDEADWLDTLLDERTAPVTLIGHSLGAGVAVAYAARHPARVSALVLIAPAFLGAPAPLLLRVPALVGLALGRMGPEEIERRFLGERTSPMTHAAAVSAQKGLRRRGGARRTARALADATRESKRAALRASLRTVTRAGVPTLIVHAKKEPLVHDACGAEIVCIDGAGHNPHLTHVDEVATAVRRFLENLLPGATVVVPTHVAADGG